MRERDFVWKHDAVAVWRSVNGSPLRVWFESA